MKNSIKILITEYTILSIIMSVLLPIYVQASDTETSDFGSNIVISGSENAVDTTTGVIIPDTLVSGEDESPTPETSNPISETGNSTETGTIIEVPKLPLGTLPPTQETVPDEDKNAEEKIIDIPEITPTEGDILIQFKSDITSSVGQYQMNQIESSLNLQTTDTIPESNIAVMQAVSSSDTIDTFSESRFALYTKTNNETSTDDIIAELKKDPNIEHVQRNFIYEITSTNDPDYNKLWSLENQGQLVNGTTGLIDADIDYPEAINYASGKLGTGVIVAVLDTGIAYDHPDLASHMWDGTNCVSDTGTNLGGCIHGYDFVNNDNNPNDGHYHGTHVAGTIGAVTSNNIGSLGISPNVSLMAVKILDDKGRGSTASIIRGINFAKYNGARVINASFGGVEQINGESDFDYLSYNAIKNFPGLFIAAAGNDGKNLELQKNTKNYPSGFGSDTLVSGEIGTGNAKTLSGTITIPGLVNVIAVAASTQNDTLASFSNYGTGTVHIAAPGTNTWSSIPVYTTQSGNIDTISLSNGWSKQAMTTSDSWETRTGITSTGETIDLSNALWGNRKTPYVSGENQYIEKSFGTVTGTIGSIGLNIWCDTPNSNFYKDYVEVLISTGGTYQSVKKIDEDIIAFNQGKDLIVESHTGKYQRYNITNSLFSNITNSNVSIRLLWHTDTIDDVENGSFHYGCAVENMGINTTNETYDYKFSNGTSMATPHVVGAAALAWSYASGASIIDVRNAILNGGDSLGNFTDKISSGKRLNLLGMLQALGQGVIQTPHLISKKITVSGESQAILNFNSDVPVLSEVLYATGLSTTMSGGTLLKSVSGEISGNNTQYKAVLTGLSSDTVYYYRVTMTSISGSITNPEFYTLYTFTTPKVTGGAITGPITVSGEIYLSGSTQSGIIMNGSTSSGFLILKSTPDTITATIPARNLEILSTSGSWNGVLSAPKIENTGGSITLISNITTPTQLSFSLGNTDNTLILSGQLASVSITGITAQSGSSIPIYYAPNTLSKYIKIGNCIITTDVCTFSSNYLGVFALGNTEAPNVITPPVILPPSCTLSINPGTVSNGSGTLLSWSISGSLSGILSPGNLLLESSGSTLIIPPINSTTAYILTVTGSGGTSSCTASVTSSGTLVIPPVNPPSGGGGSNSSSSSRTGPSGGGGSNSVPGLLLGNTFTTTQTPVTRSTIIPIKPITKKIIPQRNQLYINIRSLQSQLNRQKPVTGEARRNVILALQEFYKTQIQLMRARAGK